jgi:chemotaxis protein CheC
MDKSRNDFLAEIVNIGVGRAGSVLSELVGTKVGMSVPEVDVCELSSLKNHLIGTMQNKHLLVTLPFSGILSGGALLVMSNFSGVMLTQLLLGSEASLEEMEPDKESVITEVGNIVLNSFVGSWGDMLCDRFEFGVPTYVEGDIRSLLDPRVRVISCDSDHYAIWANTYFDVHDFSLMGTIVALFDRKSVERIVGAASTQTT